jgi:hypothetical protein
MPGSAQVAGQSLVLKGIGLRTYSVLAVHIYVAALYLVAPSHDADAILASNQPKMLLMHFVHDVPAEKIRNTWSHGLQANCIAPCVLNRAEEAKFLALLPAINAGETVALLFSDGRMQAYFDGKLAGTVPDPQFSRLLLASFLGPHPGTPAMKAALLGLPNDD